MKRFGWLVLTAFMFGSGAMAQQTAGEVVINTPATNVNMNPSSLAEAMADEAADLRFEAATAKAKAQKAYFDNRQKQNVNNRIWIILILLVAVGLKGGLLYLGYVVDQAAARPIIYSVWPQTTGSVSTMRFSIPENSFTAELMVWNKDDETVFRTDIDNSATEVEVDASGFVPGKYRARLTGEAGTSNSVNITRV